MFAIPYYLAVYVPPPYQKSPILLTIAYKKAASETIQSGFRIAKGYR